MVCPKRGGGGRAGNPWEFDFMKRIQVGILTSMTVPRVGNLTQRPLGKWRRPGKEQKSVRHIGKYPVVTWMSFLLQDSLGFWILTVDSRFQVLDSRFFISRTWIPDSNHCWVFLDSLSCILNFKAKNPDSTSKRIPGLWITKAKFSQILDSLTWGEVSLMPILQQKVFCPSALRSHIHTNIAYSYQNLLLTYMFSLDATLRQVFVKAKDKKIICRDIKISVFVLRSSWKEGFSQGEVDHLFSALVLLNFTYGLPVYGAADSDLTVIQNFLDRCFKRKYTSKRMDIRELLEKAGKKLSKVCSVDPDCPLSNIIPKKEERKYLLRNKSAYCLDIKTDRFKNVFVNRIIFRYNL